MAIGSKVKTFIASPFLTAEEKGGMSIEEAMEYLDECVNKLTPSDIVSIEDTIIPIVLPVKGHLIARRVHYIPAP